MVIGKPLDIMYNFNQCEVEDTHKVKHVFDCINATISSIDSQNYRNLWGEKHLELQIVYSQTLVDFFNCAMQTEEWLTMTLFEEQQTELNFDTILAILQNKHHTGNIQMFCYVQSTNVDMHSNIGPQSMTVVFRVGNAILNTI